MITQQDIQLSQRIKRFRRRQKLTQEKLAELLNINPKYLQRLEAGKHRPSLKLLYKLAAKLGMKPGDFFPKTYDQ